MNLYTSPQSTLVGKIDQAIRQLSQIHPLDDAYYSQCLEVFEANSDQRRELLSWLEANVVSNMSQAANAILSVGCGTGAFDQHVLRHARTHMSHVSYLGIEPNEISAAEFSRTMSKQSSEQVEISVLLQKFEEQGFENKFDLILFVQSIYYLKDRNAAIDDALRALKRGGELVIVIAPDEELNTIANLVWQRQMEQCSWFSDDVRTHLESRSLDYRETRVNANLDAQKCFGQSTEIGRKIMDFIIQTRVDRLPTNLRNDISDFLMSISQEQGATICLPHPVDIFRCKKP